MGGQRATTTNTRFIHIRAVLCLQCSGSYLVRVKMKTVNLSAIFIFKSFSIFLCALTTQTHIRLIGLLSQYNLNNSMACGGAGINRYATTFDTQNIM